MGSSADGSYCVEGEEDHPKPKLIPLETTNDQCTALVVAALRNAGTAAQNGIVLPLCTTVLTRQDSFDM